MPFMVNIVIYILRYIAIYVYNKYISYIFQPYLWINKYFSIRRKIHFSVLPRISSVKSSILHVRASHTYKKREMLIQIWVIKQKTKEKMKKLPCIPINMRILNSSWPTFTD